MTAELHERRVAAVPRGVGHATAIYAKRAKNAEIWGEDGKRYIDFASGIAVVNTGHLHPKVIAAVEQQLKAFSHACFQVTPYETYVRLAERLNAMAPVLKPAKTILFSTGAEAVENAVKIARAFTGRPGVVSFSGGFLRDILGEIQDAREQVNDGTVIVPCIPSDRIEAARRDGLADDYCWR